MRFALSNDIRVEAEPGLRGTCPGCKKIVIAKCGTRRVNHWAHIGHRSCDYWWETETEWHRSWKNNFPTNWQEIVLHDKISEEIHIADVRTDDGYVLEFQHSYISEYERISREHFYASMLWIVDFTRTKRDMVRFMKGREEFRPTNKKGVLLIDLHDNCVPLAWRNSSVPVIFDLLGTNKDLKSKDDENKLYCLFPVQFGRYGIIAKIPRDTFVSTIKNGEWFRRMNAYLIALKKEQSLYKYKIGLASMLQHFVTHKRALASHKRRL